MNETVDLNKKKKKIQNFFAFDSDFSKKIKIKTT